MLPNRNTISGAVEFSALFDFVCFGTAAYDDRKSMNRDPCLKLVLIAATLATAFVLILHNGLRFPPADAIRPLSLCGLLALALWYYHRRGVTNFVVCLQSTLLLLAFSTSFTVLMYAAATLEQPLVDADLVRCDAALGVHLPTIVAWSDRHPQITGCLQWAYNSLLYQTPVVLLLIGLAGSQRNLEAFVLQFMIAAWITILIFMWAPALGPFSSYGYPTNAAQDRYLAHLESLRDGSRTVVSWRNAEGLITIPSFHTTWAILLALAFRDWKWLLPAAIVLNTCVVISTLTSGWHYATDVLAGGAVAAVSVALVAATTRWRYPD